MQIIHINGHNDTYKHIELVTPGDEFNSSTLVTILDTCSIWGCRGFGFNTIMSAVKQLHPIYTLINSFFDPRTISALAEETNVLIQVLPSDIDMTLQGYPSIYGLLIPLEYGSLHSLVSYVATKLISTPLWIRGTMQDFIPSSFMRLGRSLDPYIEYCLSPESANAASYGIVFDNINGNSIDLPGYSLYRKPASNVILAYNQLCISAWAVGLNPVSFDEFLKGEK